MDLLRHPVPTTHSHLRDFECVSPVSDMARARRMFICIDRFLWDITCARSPESHITCARCMFKWINRALWFVALLRKRALWFVALGHHMCSSFESHITSVRCMFIYTHRYLRDILCVRSRDFSCVMQGIPHIYIAHVVSHRNLCICVRSPEFEKSHM